MNITCPQCNFSGPITAFCTNETALSAVKTALKLPSPLNFRVWGYMLLFKPKESALQWRKIARLLMELKTITTAGHVSWKTGPARPCPPGIWAEAMGRILDSPPARLPLDSHGYLQAVAYDLADAADRAKEVQRNKSERTGDFRRPDAGSAAEPEPFGGMTAEEMRRIKKENMNKK